MLRLLGWSGLCVFLITTGAQAAPKHSTKYVHYAINGDSAPEILTSLHSRGPTVYGVNAYATTHAEYSQSGDMIKTAKSCKVRAFDYSLQFTIKLPRLRNSSALTGRTAAAWTGFSKFVKAHEETHRKIWMECARSHAASVSALSGKTCDAVEAAVTKLWAKNRASCNKRHEAFDSSERKRLANQPLIRMALKGK